MKNRSGAKENIQNNNLAPEAPNKKWKTAGAGGASGNVGKLVALRLSEQFKVRGVVRNVASCVPLPS